LATEGTEATESFATEDTEDTEGFWIVVINWSVQSGWAF
jgi:hypothetical protein